MAIRFACGACGRAYELPEAAIGRQAKCECGEMLIVPTESTLAIPPGVPTPEPPPVPPAMHKPASTAKEERPPRTLHQAAEVARKKREAAEIDEAKLAALADEAKQRKAEEKATPLQAPPIDPPPLPTVPASDRDDPRDNASRIVRGNPSIWLLFFDLKLKRYLTPYLLRLVWWATLLIAALFLVSYLASAFLEKPFSSQIVGPTQNPFAAQFRNPSPLPESTTSDLVFELLGKLLRFGVFAYFLTLVIVSVRITLELCIVLFNIAETLEKIETQGKRPTNRD